MYCFYVAHSTELLLNIRETAPRNDPRPRRLVVVSEPFFRRNDSGRFIFGTVLFFVTEQGSGASVDWLRGK